MRAPRDVLLLTALAGSLLLVGLGAVALTDRDEGANAEVAREMLEQASWITPTLKGAPRSAKPALVYGLTAGAYTVLGVGETAARLPSAVAALLLVLVQYAFARWAYGRDVGWRAALVLLLSVEYVAIGRMALTDATLALFTTLAAYAFLRGWWAPPPRGRWYALAWVAAGLAASPRGRSEFSLPWPACSCTSGLRAACDRPGGGVAAPRSRAPAPRRAALVRRDVLASQAGTTPRGRAGRPSAVSSDR